jgi:type VI secretion system Hcp family effector
MAKANIGATGRDANQMSTEARARWLAGAATAFVVVAALTSAGLVGGRNEQPTNKTVEVYMAFGNPNENSGHGDWIAIDSFSWGMEHPAVVNGGYTGQPRVNEFHVAKQSDMASAILLGSCMDGSQLPDLYFESRPPANSGGATLTYRLEGTLVTGYHVNTTAGDPQDYEEITIVFEKITWTYRNGNQTVEDSWEAPVV